jgi:hypothetical protein
VENFKEAVVRETINKAARVPKRACVPTRYFPVKPLSFLSVRVS